MKRIKDIITAAKTLGLDPVALLKDCVVQFDKISNPEDVELDESDKVRVRIMRQVFDAVAAIAEDMEKPAKGDEKA